METKVHPTESTIHTSDAVLVAINVIGITLAMISLLGW